LRENDDSHRSYGNEVDILRGVQDEVGPGSVSERIENRLQRIEIIRQNIREQENLRDVQDQLQQVVEEVEMNRNLLRRLRDDLNRLQGEREQLI